MFSRPLAFCLALLVSGVGHAQEAPKKKGLYVEPDQGPRMTVDNLKNRKRLLGTDWYCVRDILIDGQKVFGGNRCQIKHGEKHSLRLAPGKHTIVLDTVSEWGGDDPDIAPMLLTLDAEAGDKDFLLILKDARKPEILSLESGDQALTLPSASSPAAASSSSAEPGPETDPYKTLERLKLLYDKGVITAEEFKDKKTEILKTIR